MIKRCLVFDVGAIVEMIPRRKKYVSWRLTTMSSSSLQEMLEMQKAPKDKHGLGYTEVISSSSSTKTKKSSLENIKMPSVEPASPVPSAREPATRKVQSEEEATSLDSVNEEYAMAVRLKVKLEPDEWIKDIRCSRNMTSNKDLCSSYKTIDEGNVVFGGKTKSKIVRKGTDIAKITRKPDKKGHENGKSTLVVQLMEEIKGLKKKSRWRARIGARGACIEAYNLLLALINSSLPSLTENNYSYI
nr:hypothetical protein [Tanacetum cinerariifolium]